MSKQKDFNKRIVPRLNNNQNSSNASSKGVSLHWFINLVIDVK